MKRREGAIISAYTGVLVGDFADMHKYIEEKLGRTVCVDEDIFDEIKRKSKDDFFALCKNLED